MENKKAKSPKSIIIVLSLILAAAVIALVLILTLKPENGKEALPEEPETQASETAETADTEFVPGENDKIVEAVDDLEYCVLTMRYYFNEEGTLYRVDHTAEYVEETDAKTDYAVIQAMNDFSEYSMVNNVIKSALTPEGIEKNYPNATVDSIVEYVTSKNMTYKVIG